MYSYDRSPESKYSKNRRRDRSRSRSRSPPRSERRRSRERKRRSRWNDVDEDRQNDKRDDRRHRHDDSGSSRKSRFSDRDEAETGGGSNYDRDRSRSWREKSDESEQYGRKDREDTSSKHQLSSIPPGPILMFRNLSSFILKEHLTQALGHQMSYIKDIRLINGRDNSNNYAFVEFYTTDDAINWMEANRNGFEVRGCHVNVDFSHHRSIDGGDKRKKEFKWSDWNCFKCGTLNFSRRQVCLTCDCTRAESDSLHEDRRAGLLPELEAEEDTMKNPPSNVLIFRGLDGLSTEETIKEAIADVSDIVIKDIRLIRDKATNTSRRFCFVETITAEEAAELNKVLLEQHPAFFVEGRRINVSYARANTVLPKPTNAVAAAAIQQAQAMNMATSSTWQGPGQQQQQQYYYSQMQSSSTKADNEPAVSQSSGTATSDAGSSTTSATMATGLPSTFLYDSTSGFYYDTITGLYYDPKTQYHYNSTTGQYCYYDATKQAYIPVSSDGNPITTTETAEVADQSKDKKKSDLGVVSGGKSAKKIAKDMERWAKSVNTIKATQQQLQQQQLVQTAAVDLQREQQILVADTPQHTSIITGTQEQSIPLNEPPVVDQSMVHAYEEELPPIAGTEVGGDSEFVNMKELTCLLCKRKFNGKEQLMKHVKLSDLHKQNLEKLIKSGKGRQYSQMTAAEQMVYRDRAKERRTKYGTDAIVPGWKKRFERERAKTVSEPGDTGGCPPPSTDTNESEPPENVGTKMLKAMGWNEGQGLGKEGQGIVKPIEAEKRTPSAGLGTPGSNYGGIYSSGNDYRATLKSLTKARYDQTFD